MKVIQRTSEEFVFPFTCATCGSQCEADANDLIKHPAGGDMRESWSESFTVKCGVCHAAISVPKDRIPPLVRMKAREQKS